MTDQQSDAISGPERMWVFPKGGWFHAGASSHQIEVAGAKDIEYVRADLFETLTARVAELEALLRRYRNETPLGHQPHMIAAEVDAALSKERE